MYLSSMNRYQTSDRMNHLYAQMASAKKIQRASDDPAGLAIAKKMESQSTTLQTDNKNMTDSSSLLNVVDGTTDSVTKGLQRIKELAIQGSNGTYTASDRALLQTEIDQIKDQINKTSESTQYNGISILNGNSLQMSGVANEQSYNISTEALGISDFDITQSFDIKKIDKALEKVNAMRGDVGATTNRLDHAVQSNEVTYSNLQSAQSRIEDIDMEHAVMQLQQQRLLNLSTLSLQKKQEQEVTKNGQVYLNMLA